MFKTLFAASVLTLMAGQAAATCPLAPGGPSLPAITHLEIIDPNVPGKPYAAAPGMNSRDVATFTGGALGKGRMILQVTLDRAVPSECPLEFEILLPWDSFQDRNVGLIGGDVEKLFPVYPNGPRRPYLIGYTDGGNRVQLTVPLFPNLNASERTYRFHLYLGSSLAAHPATTFREFQIRNRPLRLVSLKTASPVSGPVPHGSRTEIIATLNERFDPALMGTVLYRSANDRVDFELHVRYEASGGGSFNGMEGNHPSRSLFDTGYADGGDHVFYTAPAAPVTEAVSRKKAQTKETAPVKTLPGVTTRLSVPQTSTSPALSRSALAKPMPTEPESAPVNVTLTATLATFAGEQGNRVTLPLVVD